MSVLEFEVGWVAEVEAVLEALEVVKGFDEVEIWERACTEAARRSVATCWAPLSVWKGRRQGRPRWSRAMSMAGNTRGVSIHSPLGIGEKSA